MKRKDWQPYLMIAVMMMSMLMTTACSDSNGEVEKPTDLPKPETPVSDGDWQVVPTTGGKIVKDDFTIEFPNGTFKKDTKIAVVEMKKGEVGHEYEASKFYKVVMPATTNKAITIRMKSDKRDNDINFVIYSPGYAISAQKEVEIESYPETSYTNGVYTATIPICDNGETDETLGFTVGLGHIPTLDNANARSTRSLTNLNWALASGKVDGVEWNLYISWKAWYNYDRATLNKLKVFGDTLSTCINDAIKQIRKLGFKLNGNHDIPYYFGTTEKWGEFSQDWMNNNLWSSIYLSVPKIRDANYALTTDLKQTVIHETLHYFHSDYDPRYLSILKRGDSEYVALSEMGAVWVEKFMNNGQLNAEFQRESGIASAKEFRLGLSKAESDVKELFTSYSEYGYSLGPLLYYMTTRKADLAITDSNVVEIYDRWNNSDYIIDMLDFWALLHYWDLFHGNKIDDYYLKLWKGELIKDYSFLTSGGSYKTINNTGRVGTEPGKVFPYGCEGLKGLIRGFKDITMTDKELVIKQEAANVQTYLLLAEATTARNITQYPKVAIGKGDSIVISGEELEKLRKKDGEFYTSFFVLTTRKSSKTTDTGSIPTQTTIELRNVNITVTPNELTFLMGGGTKSVTVDKKKFKYVGFDKTPSWLTAKLGTNDTIKFTAEINKTGQERTDTVNCYVTNADNPTDKDKIYLPVKIIQKADAPSADPDSLTFDAAGGTQSVKITTQGFKRYGCIINDADKSWLSRQITSGGNSEVTAQPNTTGKERTATIRYYVTNVQNSTDAERIYIDVKITQKAGTSATPTVIPTSLTYEAEGGMQTLTIKVQGYKYCGCIIDDAAKSWLKKNYTGGGVYELTADPNETSQIRTTTIRCYVANEKNAPEDKKIYIDVPVTQKAGNDQTVTSKYEFVKGWVDLNVRVDTGEDYASMGGLDLDYNDPAISITVTTKGKGLHFDVNLIDNEQYYKETTRCQFDIEDINQLESQKTKVTNISWKKDVDNEGGRSWGGFWGHDGAVVSQKTNASFSSSAKIPQCSCDYDGDWINVMWFAGLEDFEQSSSYSFYRKSVLPDNDALIEVPKRLVEDSTISFGLSFRKVSQ